MSFQKSPLNKEAAKHGIVPGLIAALCCLGPLFLIMLGLISASTAASITMYSKWFLGLAIILFIGTLWFYITKHKQIICSGCQTKNQQRKRIITFVAFSAAVALLTFVLVYYVVIPWLAPVVLDNFYGGNR